MAAEICHPESFRKEAQYQKLCAHCHKAKPFHAHHVVDKNTLKHRCGLGGNALYSTRNALRLCEGLDTERCHFQHENRRIDTPNGAISTRALTDDNIRYAFDMLDAYAADYLRSEYDDTDPDPRILELELVERQIA